MKSIIFKSLRPFAFIFAFMMIVVMPWWVSLLVLITLTIYFSFYLEVLFFGFLFDVLYSVHYNFPYTGLSIATIFLLMVMFIKTRVRT